MTEFFQEFFINTRFNVPTTQMFICILSVSAWVFFEGAFSLWVSLSSETICINAKLQQNIFKRKSKAIGGRELEVSSIPASEVFTSNYHITCNWTWTHNHLVHKRTLDNLTKLAKWLSCVVNSYPYGAFDCMFLSCYVRVSE